MSENRSVVSGETQGPDSSGAGLELRGPQSAPGHAGCDPAEEQEPHPRLA